MNKKKLPLEEWSARELKSHINWSCLGFFLLGLLIGAIGILFLLMWLNKI